MATFQDQIARYLTVAIIVLSLSGIIYFGYQAVSENIPSKGTKNPFEYDIESYKRSDTIKPNYSEVQRIAVDLQAIYGIAVGRDDRVYVSGDEFVRIMDRDGRLQSTWPLQERARCLAVDADGTLYLGMRDHLEVYSGAGEKKASWGSLGAKAIITSMALSPKSVFIADAGNLIVWKFDKTGVSLGRIGQKNEARDIPGFIIPSPFFDEGLDPDGFLWVANTGRFSMENYTEVGDFRSSWGESSMDWKGFCGCCNPTHFVILPDGSFVTSEKGLVRVKEYNRLGKLVSLVAGPDQFDEGTVGLDLAVDSTGRIYVLDPPKRVVRIFAKKQDQRGEQR